MRVAVILCGAGGSSRFGGKMKKIFVEVAGKPVFLHSVNLLADMDEVVQIIFAVAAEDMERIDINWGASLSFAGVKVCEGGQSRAQTVAKALELVREDIELVAVHDAARCCLKHRWVRKVFEKASKEGAAMLACPATSTIKRVAGGIIKETVPRNGLYEAQTPQVFDRKLLLDAYKALSAENEKDITDDSMLIEMTGKNVHIVETDNTNIKVTRNCDIAIATAIINSREDDKPKYFHPFQEEKMW